MAIYYYQDFKEKLGLGNFGDDLNQMLLPKLFTKELIDCKDTCLIGIGTLINTKTAEIVDPFKKKIVFSTGVGYGKLPANFDASWEFACVRGLESAARLSLELSKGIVDGAILLSDYFDVAPLDNRKNVVFVPHVHSEMTSGESLRRTCREIGWRYLSPTTDTSDFILTISCAELVVAEAMHGAIAADAFRTRWLPVSLFHHHELKWKDWFSSIEKPYHVHQIRPRVWDPSIATSSIWKQPYHRVKEKLLARRLRTLAKTERTVLSENKVLEEKRKRLRAVVHEINSA